jgi:serine/threonine-protein kinase
LSFATDTPIRIGRYRILRRLASGGLAEVYLGVSEGPDGFIKPVAIKKLHSYFAENSSFINMLADEARVTARLDHPHIAQVLEFNYDEASGEGFLVYEFVPGRTLSQLLRQDERGIRGERKERFALQEAEVIAIAIGAARALHYAADRVDNRGDKLGVVHRDLSPPNIMVSYNGLVKVIDFGIAQARHRIERTETGVVKGKFRYMSPEQLRGDTLTHQSDLYSLGVVLFELLNGLPLYQADDDIALMAKVQACELPNLLEALPETSSELRDLLQQLLARNPMDRIASGAQLAQRMQQLLIETHQTYDPESLLNQLMQQRFPGAGETIERELSLSGAPPEAEGVRRVRSGSGQRTATMASLPTQASIEASPNEPWQDQPTLVSQTLQMNYEDDEGLVTDRIVRNPSGFKIATQTALFLLVAMATYLGVRTFKDATLQPATPEPAKVTRVALSVACPSEASVTLQHEGVAQVARPCPFAAVLPTGTYQITVQRSGYEKRLFELNLQRATRYPKEGTLPMTRITGTLSIKLTPPDAQAKVQVDGELWRPGMALLPGKRTIKIEAPGYLQHQLVAEVKGHQDVEVPVKLERPQHGYLRIIPPKRGWFDVLHRGKKLCAVPPACERLTLPAGTQTLELRSVGPTQRRRVVVQPNALRVVDLSK